MSKRIINFVVVMLFCFFVVFLGLRIGYDTIRIDEADEKFNEDTKELDKDTKSSLDKYTNLKYVDFDTIKF